MSAQVFEGKFEEIGIFFRNKFGLRTSLTFFFVSCFAGSPSA